MLIQEGKMNSEKFEINWYLQNYFSNFNFNSLLLLIGQSGVGKTLNL